MAETCVSVALLYVEHCRIFRSRQESYTISDNLSCLSAYAKKLEKSLRVRQADIADLKKLVPLFDEYRQFYGEQSDRERAENFLRDRFEQQQSTIFLAFSEGEPVGFTQLYPSFSSTRTARVFILNDLFVVPHARGKGFAKSLLAAACDYGRTVGAVRLSLSTAIDNHVAQELYEGAGWIRDKQFHVYAISLT